MSGRQGAERSSTKVIRLVTFDIDGTLTMRHGWAMLAHGLGREKDYLTTNKLFLEGHESEDAHLVRLLNIVKGVPLSRIFVLLERTARIHGIRETVRALHERGVRVALLTHNPTYICDWYRRRYHFDDAAGTVQRVRQGVVQGVNSIHADKRAGLRALMLRAGIKGGEVAHVGDGKADAAVAPHVGTFIALNTGLGDVQRRADHVVWTADLTRLLPLLRVAERPRVRAP